MGRSSAKGPGGFRTRVVVRLPLAAPGLGPCGRTPAVEVTCGGVAMRSRGGWSGVRATMRATSDRGSGGSGWRGVEWQRGLNCGCPRCPSRWSKGSGGPPLARVDAGGVGAGLRGEFEGRAVGSPDAPDAAAEDVPPDPLGGDGEVGGHDRGGGAPKAAAGPRSGQPAAAAQQAGVAGRTRSGGRTASVRLETGRAHRRARKLGAQVRSSVMRPEVSATRRRFRLRGFGSRNPRLLRPSRSRRSPPGHSAGTDADGPRPAEEGLTRVPGPAPLPAPRARCHAPQGVHGQDFGGFALTVDTGARATTPARRRGRARRAARPVVKRHSKLTPGRHRKLTPEETAYVARQRRFPRCNPRLGSGPARPEFDGPP